VEPRIVRRDPRPLAAFGRAFVVGERPGEGPVEALRAALRVCAAPWALVLAVDMPGVTPGLLRRLIEAAHASPGEPGFVFAAGGRVHPFPGIYRPACRERCAGERSMHGLIEAAGVSAIEAPDAASAFRNVNRPADLG
jgi:molybdopterin-guanine dinucleotide biosynthesis protein A